MKRLFVALLLLACVILPERASAQKAALIMAGTNPPSATDQAAIDRLQQEFGMETVLIDHAVAGPMKNQILDDEEPDLIIILESTSSANVLNQLNDREEPIIVQEWFLLDDMGFVTGTAGCDFCWGDLGNDFGNQSGVTDIDIVSDHAIIQAAGLEGEGTIAIYEFPGRLQWGNNLIDDAEVLAVATDGFDEDGDGVSDDVVAFVIEPGAELVDGSELAGLRIGCWIHSTDDGFINQTPRSLDFWDAMVTYALDSTEPPPGACAEPPASATRAIQTVLLPDQTTCGGDFKDGDAISVQIQIADLRAAAGDCAVPAAVRVTETPPAGWTVSGISDGGTVTDGGITWTLAGGDLAAGKTVTYTVTASAPDVPARFTFDGELVELDAAGNPLEGRPEDVEGEDSLLSDPDECPGKAVIILANPASPPAGDRAMIDRLEQEFGMETVLIDDNDPEASKIAVIEAERPTLIFVFESVGSGNVGTQLNDRPEPLIFHEPFLYDDMGFVAGTAGCDNCWGDLGNDFGNQSGESDLDVVNHDHPIVRQAGLQDVDTFATFEPTGRLLWGRNFIDEAEVLLVATNGYDEDGDGLSDDAALVVVEEGAELLDGTENAGLRIGGWIHAEGDAFNLLTEEGLALWDACVLYALGRIDDGPAATRIVRSDADSDGNITLTDGIAILAWLFQGSDEPPCLDAADTDDDGRVLINDAVVIFGWLFSGGAPPAAPAPTVADYPPGDCGVDVNEDELGCAMPSPTCAG